MTEAVTNLRQEVPALGLTVGFSSPADRDVIADGLLLWVEVRRACLTQENLVAATRLTWWRDALSDQRGHGVPLAERLILHKNCDALAKGLDAKMMSVLHGEPNHKEPWSDVIGQWYVQNGIGHDPTVNASILDNLDEAFVGKANDRLSSGQISLDLISWCCSKPSRLNYPDQHPLLALQMMIAAITLPRRSSSG